MTSIISILKSKYPETIVYAHKANIGGNILYLWLTVENHESIRRLILTYLQKRQLFLELVEYYMQKGLLRFPNHWIIHKDSLKKKYWRNKIEEAVSYKKENDFLFVKWTELKDEFPNVKIVIHYLSNCFPKTEKEFECHDTAFFYGYCPPAQWYDKEEKEWIESD